MPRLALHLLAVAPDGTRHPVVVTGGDPTVAEVATAVAATIGHTDPTPTLHRGATPLDGARRASEAGLAQGSLVGMGVPVVDAVVADPGDDLEAVVTGGLHAGRRAGLAPGSELAVGRRADADLPLPDPEVSRSHLTLTRGAGGDDDVEVVDAGSQNGIGRRGHRVDGRQPLEAGEPLAVGASLVEVRAAVPVARVLEPVGEDGTRRFNRPPRILPPLDPPEVVLPTEPREPTARRIPVLAALIPLLIGVVMLAVIGPSPFLLFILLSPVLLAGNAWSDRRHGRKEHRAARARYEAELAQVGTRLAEAVVDDERMRRHAHPDPGEVLATALGPGARLWERRVADADHLALRVGTADRPARVRVIGGDRAEHQPPPARTVPVVVDLAAAGVAGVAIGPRPIRTAVARALLAQVTTLHGPRDVRVAVITAAEDAADWEWLAWTPHTAPLRPDTAPRLVATDRLQAEARLAELRALVAARVEARRERFGSDVVDVPRVVLVLDGARRLRHVRGLAEVLRDGPAVGVVALCLDADEHSLPEECRATVVAEDERGTRGTVRRPGREPVPDVLLDGLDPALADRLGRALAPVRDLGGDGDGPGAIPATARFLDLAGLPEPTREAVAAGWAAGGRTTRALLGVGPDGPLTVDLRRDGPHALLAGTTGAGKSELLQTLVASLALGNRPDALAFVLVDYKGGAAFRDAARLPHCAGLITDLDGHLVDRALRSLDAELKRRERLLADAGAKDIDDLLAGRGQLARLVIVIDEFASLVEEVPDFVTGVVGIGMRGRSLGVHVVLATQRPGGVVTADLRANVNLRLCLRVADPQESIDVVDRPDAAAIPRSLPGRALARTGRGEVTAFQTARIGGPRPGAEADDVPVDAWPATLPVLGTEPLADVEASDAVADAAETDLSVLVDAVASAAAGADRPAAPWLPPLAEAVPVAELDDELATGQPSAGPAGGPLTVALGRADLPTEQAQVPFAVDLARVGNLAVVGTARSGRSTVVRTLVGGMAAVASPDELHVHAIDGGARDLAGLTALPHVGAVVPVDDVERVERVVRLVGDEIDRRQRGEGEPTTVVLVVDGYEAVVRRCAERDGGWVLDDLDRIGREGPSVGVHVVLTTDRSGFTLRLASAFPGRLVLRQADRDDDAVVGLDARQVPAHRPPGRGIWVDGAVEVQVAHLGADPSSAAQDAALADLGHRVAPAERGPRRVAPLPAAVDLAELAGAPRRGGEAVLGVDEDGEPLRVDVAALAPGYVVAGPPGSGRSTALLALLRSLPGLDDGRYRAVVLAPRPSPLRDLDHPAVTVLPGGVEAEELDEVLDEALDTADAGVVLVIDDAELVPDGKLTRALEVRVRSARDEGLALLVAATTDDLLLHRYRGWLADVRRGRTGLLLAPASPTDGEVFDLKLPRSTGGTVPAGRGLAVARGRWAPVQVARPAALAPLA